MTFCHSTRAPVRRAVRVAVTCTSATLLLVALKISIIASAEVAAEEARKSRKGVRVTADQMHQLNIVKVETYPFRVQKSAIGRIAYNEDTSTLVLTPFSGRVIRLIAKIGDTVKRGDPLFEIDSPEVVQPQNDFIAAFAALNKARSQLDLAQIVENTAEEPLRRQGCPAQGMAAGAGPAHRRAE